MKEPRTYDLGIAEFITAEAVGRPGQRTFKITAKSTRGEVVIWLEKEQLNQVALSIKQVLDSKKKVARPAAYVAGDAVGLPAGLEFKAGDMALRYDAATDVLTLAAANFNEDAETGGDDDDKEGDEQPVQVDVSFRRSQAERFADQAVQVVVSGRKPCPLCGGPVDPAGHFCVKKNGFHKQHE